MARPKNTRCVRGNPKTTYFKPAGIKMSELEEEILTIEEYEAIRHKDYNKNPQDKSAEMMEVSQPTFHRIITSAREKIAKAIVDGKAIKIEGGNYKFKIERCGRKQYKEKKYRMIQRIMDEEEKTKNE